MLNNHPRLCVPYESHIYNVFWKHRERYEPLIDRDRQRELVNDILTMHVFRDWHQPPAVDSVVERVSRGNFHGVFEAVLQAWADGQDKPRWGEKTPANSEYWRVIHKGFPDARFVHVVRDGRDCALSMIRARFGPKLVYTAAARWAHYVGLMQQMKQELGGAKVHEIRYADLVTDPEQTLRSLCHFLGEPHDPAMLSYHQNPGQYKTDATNRVNLTRPPISSNVGKWRTQMAPAEQCVFEALAADKLKDYGYPTLRPDARITPAQRLYYQYILHPPKRILAMLRNTKGWADSLIRLKVLTRLMLKRPLWLKPARA